MEHSRVYVAMSGGVDSAGAALLLQKLGYDVTGVTLRLRPGAEGDIDDARRAAQALGVPHEVLDCQELFRHQVMDPFVGEYCRGRTPNPCLVCNRRVKFGALLDYALARGADYLATGHYARLGRDEETGRYLLLRGRDRRKDQSYVLYQLTQRQLGHLLLHGTAAVDKQLQPLRDGGITFPAKINIAANFLDGQSRLFQAFDDGEPFVIALFEHADAAVGALYKRQKPFFVVIAQRGGGHPQPPGHFTYGVRHGMPQNSLSAGYRPSVLIFCRAATSSGLSSR